MIARVSHARRLPISPYGVGDGAAPPPLTSTHGHALFVRPVHRRVAVTFADPGRGALLSALVRRDISIPTTLRSRISDSIRLTQFPGLAAIASHTNVALGRPHDTAADGPRRWRSL